MGMQSKNFSDLVTFTRASGGTSFRPVGRGTLVNLLLWSNDLNQRTAKTNVNISGVSLIPTVTSGVHAVTDVVVSVGQVVTYAFRAKANGYRYLGASNAGAAAYTATFDLVAGVCTVGGSITAADIVLQADGYYICRASFVAAYTTVGLYLSNTYVTNISNWAGDGTSGYFVDGIGLFQGTVTAQQIIDNGGIPLTFTSADNVVRIDTPGDPIQLFTVPANYPRRDYDPVTGACKGLLVEEQRTNLITHSHEFDNAAWTKINSSVTASATVAPDGTLTADKLIEAATNAQHRMLLAPATTSGASYTNSIYLKAAERGWAYLIESNYVTAGVYVNLITGTLGSVVGTGAPSASISNAGNGWFRVSLTYTAGGASSRLSVMLATGDGGDAYLGDGVSGIFVWGAQMEAGAFPTSYIPTAGAAATRALEQPVVNTLSPWYNTQEGTLLMDIGSSKTAGATLATAACLVGPSSATNFVIPAFSTTGVSTIFVGAPNISSNAATTGQAARVALGMSLASQVLVVNGSTPVQRSASAAIDLMAALRLGYFESNPGALNGHIKRIQYIPKRLSDAKLQALTTLTYGAPYGVELASQDNATLRNNAAPTFDTLTGATFSNSTDKVSVGYDNTVIPVVVGRAYQITVSGNVASGSIVYSLRASGALGTARAASGNYTAGSASWSTVYVATATEDLTLRVSSNTGSGATAFTLSSRSVKEATSA